MGVGQRLVKIFIFLIFLAMLGVIAVQWRLIKLPPQNLNEAPGWFTAYKLKSLDLDPEACSVALDQAGIDGTLQPDEAESATCQKQGTVLLSKLSDARMKEEQTRCNIAARLYMWERNVVQPAARRYFHQSVAEVTHLGSYNCRTIHGSSHMSEHATANAIDITGFKLANGKLISIRIDWNKTGPESDFLHEMRAGICKYYNLTLSPDYNADHADHFHVDMGWVRGCH